MPTTRSHDLVLFGATGFTGGLTARYLASNAPAGLRWALAGRDRARLVRRRAELAELDPGCAGLPLLRADVSDPASLRAVAADTRVVITTVGPYLRYGEPLVAACADAGTDYVDLTGEPSFVDQMYLRHHRRAVRTGARLVHSCGFESVPLDLGVLHTVRQLPEHVPIRIEGYVAADTGLSGGSIQTTLTVLTRPLEIARAERARRQVERFPPGRTVSSGVGAPRKVAALGAWAMPMPTISRLTVGRSARALPRYGPDFRYEHRFLKHPLVAAGGAIGLLALSAAAQLPPVRRLLGSVVKPGEGPSEAKRAACWFTITLFGEGGGRRVVTEVSGGDPGYNESAKILAESALCLALDQLPPTSGQVTPATAMGGALFDRLRAAGIRFRSWQPTVSVG